MAIRQHEPIVFEVQGAGKRKIILRAPQGMLELTYNEGPDGQAELRIDGTGNHAVWVGGDLVLGGEELDGYL